MANGVKRRGGVLRCIFEKSLDLVEIRLPDQSSVDAIFQAQDKELFAPHLRLNPAPITIRMKSTRMIPIKGAPDIEGISLAISTVSITNPET